MKKAYKTPTTEVLALSLQGLLMASGVQSPDKGIGYGGIDDEGTQDPSARRRHSDSQWDEASDEEW